MVADHQNQSWEGPWVDGNGRDLKGVQMDANQIYLIAVSIDNVRRVLVRYVSLFL